MSKASKLVLMLFMGLLFAGKAHVQELKYAPTIEQCHADQRLWSNTLEHSPSKDRQNYETLNRWYREMFECTSVDPDNPLPYLNVNYQINVLQTMRLEHFLGRHGLYDKFIEEDKAGKR